MRKKSLANQLMELGSQKVALSLEMNALAVKRDVEKQALDEVIAGATAAKERVNALSRETTELEKKKTALISELAESKKKKGKNEQEE